MAADWRPRRGSLFGCGMGTIPLGAGVVGIPEIYEALNAAGFSGDTTLEVAGPENVRQSLAFMQSLGVAAPSR